MLTARYSRSLDLKTRRTPAALSPLMSRYLHAVYAWGSERARTVELSQGRSQAGEFERKPSSLSRGTEGSNPPPSTGESVANLTPSIEAPKILPSTTASPTTRSY